MISELAILKTNIEQLGLGETELKAVLDKLRKVEKACDKLEFSVERVRKEKEVQYQLLNKTSEDLREALAELEERVRDRTRNLERRTVQLATAAEVASSITALRDLKELLPFVTTIIAERFGFYHVAIYLVDEDNEHLYMAANSRVKSQNTLLETMSTIRIGERSVISQVAASKTLHLVSDTQTDEYFRYETNLPETQSELSLPLVSGGSLLGVLDVQSNLKNAFDYREVQTLQGMANQVATALENARLYQLRLNYAREMEMARETAESANLAKSSFLANMSHELRTPLNAILGFAQLMHRDQSLNDQHKENLTIIGRSGEHLLSLINDILEMSKIEAGRTTLNEADFDLHRMLKELEQMVRVRSDKKNLILRFERSNSVPQFVQGDEGKLRQVLFNLLGNAIKFTLRGSVILRVAFEKHTNCLHFEVEDTGPGISQADQFGIFEAFVQTAIGRKSQEGTGLGLPISRQFVRLMGGDIRLSSELGLGTTFKFEIKVGTAEAKEIQTERHTRRAIGIEVNQPNYRILVADDKLENRLLLVKLLEAVGLTVREATNGKEALEIFLSWKPDLIWMDMRMPIMDGYEATRQIKQTIRGQKTIVIALTASAFEHERSNVLETGCDDFVPKPFRHETIFDKMAEHLGIRFVYEGQEIPLNLEPLSQLKIEPTLRLKLQEAATQLDPDLTLEVIEQIRLANPALADSLIQLVRTYRFDQILEFTEQAS